MEEIIVFDIIKKAIESVLGSDYYLLVPQLENATHIISYIICILFFLIFFLAPTLIFFNFVGGLFSSNSVDNSSSVSRVRRLRKRRR